MCDRCRAEQAAQGPERRFWTYPESDSDDFEQAKPNWAAVAAEVNWELLDLCISYAILHPDEFDMAAWTKYGESRDTKPLPEVHVNGVVRDDPNDNAGLGRPLRAVKPTLCGTTACLAGTALLLKGYGLVAEPGAAYPGDVWRFGHNDSEGRRYRDDEMAQWLVDGTMSTPDGSDIVKVDEEAYRLLGIPKSIAAYLAEEYDAPLFYGKDVEAVIDTRNTLVRVLGHHRGTDVVERDFAEVYTAKQVYDLVESAMTAGRLVRARTVAEKEREQATSGAASEEGTDVSDR